MYVKKLKDHQIADIMRVISDPDAEVTDIRRPYTDPEVTVLSQDMEEHYVLHDYEMCIRDRGGLHCASDLLGNRQ